MSREEAYEAAVHLYTSAIRSGSEAVKATGTGGWKVSPVNAETYHRHVLEVAEFLATPDSSDAVVGIPAASEEANTNEERNR